jgi:hypothetical protein
VAIFFHLRDDKNGRAGRTIPILPPMTAHYDAAGLPIGLQLPLPTTVGVNKINDALRELGDYEVAEDDLVGLRIV